MRRFQFLTQIIGSLFGGWTVLQSTRKGPRDWRLILMWVSWAATLAIAIGSVVKEQQDGTGIKG